MLRIDTLTLFPKMFKGVLDESIIKRAKKKRLVKIEVHDLRRWSKDKHKKVDDRPYGGGPGMILSCQPMFDAVSSLIKRSKQSKVILLSPQGKRFNQETVNRLAKQKHLVLICGRYEGVDERVKQALVTDEISIGDYVLTGGEIPAMAMIDAITRMVPGVLGNKESTKFESFQNGMLEHPQYTRPRVYKNLKVPEVLLTGNHKKIENWKYKKSLKITRKVGIRK